MVNLASQIENYPVFQEIGTVVKSDDTDFLLTSDNFQYRARKAAGCLLCPEIDDKVLFVTDPSGKCYILTVLEKSRSAKKRILIDGDAEILCKEGKINLIGHQGINLVSPEQISLTTSHLKAVAEQGDCSISQLSFLGSFLLCRVASIKMLVGKIELLCDRLQQRIKRSYRTVEDTEQLKAGKIDYRAERLMSLHGQYSILTASEDVKIDGERIHMG